MIKYKQFLNILLEGRLDKVKELNKEISTSHDPYAEHKNPSDIVDHFAEKADPSANKVHTQWIVGQYKKGHIRQEDAPRVFETLKKFQKHKHLLLPEQRNLGNHKHITDLEKALEPHEGQKTKREEIKEIKHSGAEKIHDENGVTVHHLKNKEAACQYGKNTKWCFAATGSDNMFDQYNEHGKIYHVKARDENGKMAKYAFHHESGQYMDDHNDPVDVHELVKRNPELKNVKEFQGKHPALTSDENFDKHFEKLLKSHPRETMSDSRLKEHHIDKALNPDMSIEVRATAARHPNATKEHLDKALDDKNPYVREAAARNHNITKGHHIDKTLNPDMPLDVRKAAARHPNATKEHLDKALGDNHPAVREVAASHPNATKEHLDKALEDKDTDVRLAAVRHPNATKEHLDKALEDKDIGVRRAAASHPNINSDTLHKLVTKSNDAELHTNAANNKNVNHKTLRHSFNKFFYGDGNKDPRVLHAVLNNPKFKSISDTELI